MEISPFHAPDRPERVSVKGTAARHADVGEGVGDATTDRVREEVPLGVLARV